MYADLVEQPLRQVLLAQVGAAHDGDVGVAGRGSRLLKGALGPSVTKVYTPPVGTSSGTRWVTTSGE